jgi:hypothetical protein
LSFLPGRNTFCPISALAGQKYLSAWQKTNHAHKLLYFPELSVLMSSVCKYFRSGYIDRYRRRLTTYSIKMKNLPIYGMYSILSLFFLALAVTTTVCPIFAQQKTNDVKLKCCYNYN